MAYFEDSEDIFTTIYIDNIDKNCNEDQFIDYFQQFGEIVSVNEKLRIHFWLNDKAEYNNGDVTYVDYDSALKVIKETHNKQILGLLVVHSHLLINDYQQKQRNMLIEEGVKTKYKDSNIYLTSNNAVITLEGIVEKLGEGKGVNHFYNIQTQQHPQREPIEQPQPDDEELINIISDQIYDYVEQLGEYDEDLIARITGVFLESFDVGELERKLKNPEQELSPVIDEIADTLRNMAQDE
ncbi:hypothetical protein QTN25_003043 [Entamoeba marina]